MNYYEELGLAPSAATEEIRQAYKNLARLLHPDRQSDAHLRKMAELQMTRLNDILAELTDPVRRERYDAALQESTATRPQNHLRSRTPIHLHRFRPGRLGLSAGAIVWSSLLTATAIAFVFVFLYFDHDPARVVYHPTENSALPMPAPAKVPDGIIDHPARRNQDPRANEPPLPHPAPMSDTPQNFETTPLRPASGEPLQPPRVEIAQPPAPAIITKPAAASAHPLIGTWLYVKPQTEEAGNKNLSYRPEYIEMIIKPAQKGVCGKYRGQFHVPDRPLSSEVVLRFEGAAAEGNNVFAWQADDGASGQIRMNVISDGVLEVSWYTTRFGSAPKLASGTAVLHRD